MSYRTILILLTGGGLIPSALFLLLYPKNLTRDDFSKESLPITIYLLGHTFALFLLYTRSVLNIVSVDYLVPPDTSALIVTISLAVLIDVMQWLLLSIMIYDRRRNIK